jgi:glycosidase
MSEPGATLQRLELAFTVLTTMRGMPQIYSGDEIAMKGGEDPDNRRDFPGGFASSQSNAFTSGGRTPEQQQAFTTLQNLLTLRRLHPALQTGDEQVLHADNDVFIFVRTWLVSAGASQHILVAVNKSHASQSVTMTTDDTAIAGLQQAKTLQGDSGTSSFTPHAMTLQLAPESAVILDMQ